MKLVPQVVETFAARWGLGLSFKRFEQPKEQEQSKPITLPQADESQSASVERDWETKEFRRHQTLKAEAAASRTKLKTERLEELGRQLKQGKRKSSVWFAKYDAYLQSPAWTIASEQALRKACFRCEYLGCSRRARQAHLLEFPKQHLETDFNWEDHKPGLIALCCEHHMMMHRLVMKTIIPANHEFVQFFPVATKPSTSGLTSGQVLRKS